MAKKNTVPEANGDLETRVALLEGKIVVLEELRAAIGARLLEGQEEV